MKRIYIAAYHQSKFGKLLGMSVPEILRRAVLGSCAERLRLRN
jgi:acetyl-CoA C-acetyltransferase